MSYGTVQYRQTSRSLDLLRYDCLAALPSSLLTLCKDHPSQAPEANVDCPVHWEHRNSEKPSSGCAQRHSAILLLSSLHHHYHTSPPLPAICTCDNVPAVPPPIVRSLKLALIAERTPVRCTSAIAASPREAAAAAAAAATVAFFPLAPSATLPLIQSQLQLHPAREPDSSLSFSLDPHTNTS